MDSISSETMKISKNDTNYDSDTKQNEMNEMTFVTESKLYESIEVLKKVAKNNPNKIYKKQLFEDDFNFVFLQFALKKIPENFSTYIHYICLPFHWRHEINYDTCLIVKDLNEVSLTDREADLEQTRNFYRNLLNKHSANELISEILPMRQLRNEFRLPTLKKKLSSEYNAFLCDKKLIRNKHSFLSRFLGKAFWIDNKKVPILINLNDKNLKNQIDEKLNQTSLYVSGKGSTLTVCIGSLQQDSKKLTKNLLIVLEKIKQLYDKNVRELAIKTEKSMSILFYMDLGSANAIQLSEPKKNKQNLFVEDEFDFLTNSNVRVFRDGHIRIIKRKKPEEEIETEQRESNEMNFIKSFNNKPDEEHWPRRLVFKMPRHMNIISILAKRQYHLNNRGSQRNFCPVFKSNFIPFSSFEALNVDQRYSFIDLNENGDSPITSITCNDQQLLLANDVGDIVLLNKSLDEIKKFRAHNCAIFDVKWRPKNLSHILTAAGDRSIILWDLNRSNLVESFFTAHYGSVKTISFQSPYIFISGGRDGAIKLWDIRDSFALKRGPLLMISDPHIHKLPQIKSHFKTLKSRRQNPIAWSSENINYHASNVVTCVSFHPTNNNYFYSSGIADNAIKVWDIRCCRRCSLAPIPAQIHTTSNISIASTNQGYSSFIINETCQGPILFASATNGSIYAFTSNSTNPVMVLSGRYSNFQTKISSFGEDYLLSGSTNSYVYLWNCNLKSFLMNYDCTSNEDIIYIENRLPIYELDFSIQQEIPLVIGDFKWQNIYCSAEPNVLWKWSFNTSQEKRELFLPKCNPFVEPENFDKTVKINLKRSSSFELINCKNRCNSAPRPLSSITNWIQSETKRFKSEENTKETPVNGDENRIIVSKSTSHKMAKNRTNKRNTLKRNLFNDNRKIKEFFTIA